MAGRKKVLLSTVFRPYAAQNSKYNKDGDEEWLDYLSSRLTREPGPFTMSAYLSGTTLALIGANLDADVTVLGHPSMEEFIAELKKGPDFVGLSFLIKGLGKLFPMIAAARKYAPNAKIVVGGFGTMLHNLGAVGADYLCKGEGISFFRNLIGQDPADPVRQPLVTGDVTLKCFRSYPFLPRARYAELTHGFGCPHKCEFCTTSAYFGFLHIPFAVGRSMYDAMVDIHDRLGISYFYLYEEDMCLYKKSLQEWGGLIRDDAERTLSWTCFSTIKSLTSWDLEELVSMGFSHVWIGVESINSPFSKSVGRDNLSLFRDLQSFGVTTTGSLIFGLDHHAPENLKDEVDHLVELYPATAQMGTLMPADGTALRARLEAEGRVRKGNYWDSDLYSELIIHPAFQPGQLSEAVFWGYDEFYRRTGPAIHRLARTWLQGARRMKHSPNAALRRRAAVLAERARTVRPILLETGAYLPTDEIREAVRETLSWMKEEFGPPTAAEEAQARLVERIFALETAKREVFPPEPIEPDLRYRRWISGQEVPARFQLPTAA
ncbi:MAG TPA: hypothetical protein VGG03_23430 [Thermoanaerobaculia bacterium]|jgi:haloalkane dehalogenase